ncbi:MAG: PepSY-associated TM helix domain-containing protein [Candidatus Krumholzibacteria bacterium]|nr:PepSY-associated TM helix domain-containing protein [Candidatus Krumholzibacteria bacterium]
MGRLRKVCRFLHRELGFLAVGMTLVYAVSGVAVNHNADWNPSYERAVTTWKITSPGHGPTEEIAPAILAQLDLDEPVRNVWRATPNTVRVIVPSGTIDVDLLTGRVRADRLRPRPLLRELNFLHLNHSKGAWTWIADAYALILVILALSGIVLVKGRLGLAGRGGVWLAAGVLLPVVWAAVNLYL